MIINAENLVLGRLATFAAKKAMQGDMVEVVNSEKAIITGRKEDILQRYERKRSRGDPHHGPYFPIEPERILRRTIRGMIPHKQPKGKEAFKNVKCYKGIPASLRDKEMITLETAQLRDSTMKYMQLGRLAKLIGSNDG